MRHAPPPGPHRPSFPARACDVKEYGAIEVVRVRGREVQRAPFVAGPTQLILVDPVADV